MTGDLLTRITRALLHEDTFELMVAPAIADLQLEPTPAGYAAVGRSAVGALCYDIDGDLRLVCDDIGMLATLVLIQASYYSGMLLLLVARMNAKEALEHMATFAPQLVAAILFILGLSLFPTLLCFWPARRTGPHDPQLQA